jgi:Na+-transporting methylmalonyl-CoA/oxaloacetate decarboxylase gamma subunit
LALAIVSFRAGLAASKADFTSAALGAAPPVLVLAGVLVLLAGVLVLLAGVAAAVGAAVFSLPPPPQAAPNTAAKANTTTARIAIFLISVLLYSRAPLP